MPGDFRHLRCEQDGRGVVTVWLDVAGRSQNVLSDELLGELGGVAEAMATDAAVRAVVFRSRKEGGFVAGADLRQLQAVRTPAQGEALAALGQRVFDRIAALPMPTIAAIHGPCLGGGLEFALACRHRLVRDEPRARLGLPEVRLGLIPAWGGTRRLPHRVGLSAALEMIVSGREVPLPEAQRRGLVDRLASPDSWESAVEDFVSACLVGTSVPESRRASLSLWDRTAIGRQLRLWQARRRIARMTEFPTARAAAYRVIVAGLTSPPATADALVRTEFGALLLTADCRAQLAKFFERRPSV